MSSKVFNDETYKIEGQIKHINENGREQINICAVDNIVRWRFAKESSEGYSANEILSEDTIIENELDAAKLS